MIGDHNRIESDGQSNYQYDHEGNRISRTSIANGSYQLYEWNYRNQLTAVTNYTAGHHKTGRVEYEYDALNRRIRRRVDETGDGTFEIQQRFLYDTNVYNASYAEAVLIIDETAAVDSPSTFDPSQEVEHRFLNGPMLDQVFSDENAVGEIVWNLQDRQNTVTDVVEFAHTDSDGHYDEAQLLNHLEYDAHGSITSQTNSSHQPLQTYTGQMLDDVTGLMYYDARWFDPNVNQFTSEDPLGFAAGDTNLRRYAANANPNATDPDGMQIVWGYPQRRIWFELRYRELQDGAHWARIADMYAGTPYEAVYRKRSERHWQNAATYRHWIEVDLAREREMTRSRLRITQWERTRRAKLLCGSDRGSVWHTKWVHIYDPDGRWLATFEYDSWNKEEEDLAKLIAAKTKAGVTIEQLEGIITNGVASGVELGLRVGVDAVDVVMSTKEFFENPSLRNGTCVVLAAVPIVASSILRATVNCCVQRILI